MDPWAVQLWTRIIVKLSKDVIMTFKFRKFGDDAY